MKKIIILTAVSSLFILGCKTRRVQKDEEKKEKKIEVVSKQEAEETKIDNLKVKKDSQVIKNEEKHEEKKDIEIKGKVDKENPLIYYNIVKGDTLDILKISGIADIIYKSSNNSQKSNENTLISNNNDIKKESKINSSSNSQLDASIVEDVQNKSVEIVKKGFTFMTYLTFFLWGLAIIVLLVIILWLRKSTFWVEIVNKIKNLV